MSYLLDTNVLSELTKPAPSARVLAWLAEHETDAWLSAVTIGELARGIEALADGKKKRRLVRRLRFFQEDYRDRILAFDEAVAMTWARHCQAAARAGHQLQLLDSLIAATAVHYELTVATENIADFPLAAVVNPFAD